MDKGSRDRLLPDSQTPPDAHGTLSQEPGAAPGSADTPSGMVNNTGPFSRYAAPWNQEAREASCVAHTRSGTGQEYWTTPQGLGGNLHRSQRSLPHQRYRNHASPGSTITIIRSRSTTPFQPGRKRDCEIRYRYRPVLWRCDA